MSKKCDFCSIVPANHYCIHLLSALNLHVEVNDDDTCARYPVFRAEETGETQNCMKIDV